MLDADGVDIAFPADDYGGGGDGARVVRADSPGGFEYSLCLRTKVVGAVSITVPAVGQIRTKRLSLWCIWEGPSAETMKVARSYGMCKNLGHASGGITRNL